MKHKKILTIALAGIISLNLGMQKFSLTPKTVYHVYLKGKSIGLVESKEDLEKYIDREQESLKEKYNIKKVYAPDELDIKKEITYKEDISSSEEIYTKIKDSSSFSIDGYEINIKKEIASKEEDKTETKNIKIYVIDKKVFTDSIDKTVKSFITNEDYNTYKSNKKQKIKETGKIIEKIYIENDITIKKGKIPTNKKIYQEVDELSRYLLFGTTKSQAIYTIKDGDTINDIAYNNKMSNEEFLIMNPEFTSENALLYAGQNVNIGILNPQINIVEEDEVVAYEEKKYQTETRYDNSKTVGYQETTQQGVNGKNRVTQKVRKVNGETTNIITANTEEITPVINEIIVKGGKEELYTGSPIPTAGAWGWPASCNSVSSPFGYRWGTLHDGTDIAGCGRNSAIYAAQSGTVIIVAEKWDNGKYIVINHNNGYYTMYAHLQGFAVKKGQQVEKGQVIGGMGDSGFATGVHLHYSIWLGGPPYSGGKVLNAMSMY
ncbi:MAG: peptidoglycan DD-metalloendopeptidase family protein [Bacilli bacterium]|nr:peptidoglycan DD-metalloendopeptidase family protein [Bacilli bacterium]